MERLTEKTTNNLVGCSNCIEDCFSEMCSCNCLIDAIIELKRYEDLMENGKIIILPFVVGDTFWEINCASEPYAYPRKALSIQHCVYAMERLGETVFHSESEAEVAIEKMEV